MPPHLTARLRLVALIALAVVVVAAASLGVRSLGDRPAAWSAKLPHPGGAAGCGSWWILEDGRDDCLRADFERAALDGGAAAVAAAERDVRKDVPLWERCHNVLHEVGAEYVRERGVTPDNVDEHLPTSTSTECVAGFTHGMLVELLAHNPAPEVAGQLAGECTAQPKQMLRKNCVHGLGHSFVWAAEADYGRSLELCGSLGRFVELACGAGVFHELQMHQASVEVSDHERAAPEQELVDYCSTAIDPTFVEECFLRAWANEGTRFESADDVRDACDELAGRVREGCVTGAAAAIQRPSDASEPEGTWQLHRCGDLDGPDAVACIQGLAFPVALGRELDVALRDCDAFDGPTRSACVVRVTRWAAAVDGLDAAACASLAAALRDDCRAGIASLPATYGVF